MTVRSNPGLATASTWGDEMIEVFDDLFPGVPDAATRFLLSVAGTAEPVVVELGCGSGRYLVPLAANGARCTGWDISERMLVEAHRRADSARVDVVLKRRDILSSRDAGPADLVLCLGATLGMFPPREQARVFRTAAALLRPGATFVVETHHAERVRRLHSAGPLKVTFNRAGPVPVHSESEFDHATGYWQVAHRWEGSDGPREVTEEAFPLSAEKLGTIARDEGFSEVRRLGGWDGRAVGPDHPQVIHVYTTPQER